MLPTLDSDVRSALRSLHHPITLFGEDPSDRRQRLQTLLDSGLSLPADNTVTASPSSSDDEEFFTPGPDDLYVARTIIADSSLLKAKQRIAEQRRQYLTVNPTDNLLLRRSYYADLKSKLQLQGSQMVSNRFTSAVKFSPDDKLIAAASWDGGCYLFDSETLELHDEFKGLHSDKVSAVDWMPSGGMIATGGGDGRVVLTTLSAPVEPAAAKAPSTATSTTIFPSVSDSSPPGRITSLQFHPSSPLLASASYDLTWRLFDVTKMTQLYYQEGHSKELTSLRIHPDGSLLASAGLDAIARIWDLRTGRSIATLQNNGHIKAIHAMDWRPNGYQLITGGSDNNLKVWDLRRSDSAATETLVAHSKVITGIKVAPNDKYMVTCGYDGYLNVMSCDNFVTLKRFKNVDKLMCCDVSGDSEKVIGGGWDRALKLWSC
ncbi:DEKNAAC105458 [Brettanomyces naardenensis]|uniref:DEKNAAC105458 n=1 Tax=Brettanomyces naardenensis TaxID=13370 RepID=A0A448YTF9_BRENA|nr:DEKNAAC105458 [Brettanomyces naardenensis]